MPSHDANSTGANRLRGFHVHSLAQRKHRRPHHAHHARRLHHRKRDDHVLKTRAQHRHQRDGKQEGRNRHQPVHQSHDDRVHHPVVAGNQTQNHAADHRNYRHRDAYRQRKPAAVHHAREYVPAQMISAEQVLARWRLQAFDRVDVPRIHVRNLPGKDRHQRHDDQQYQTEQHIRVLDQRAPRGDPRALPAARASAHHNQVGCLLSGH